MTARLIGWALDHRPVVLLLTLVLAAAGGWALARLPIDAVPDITNVQVQVTTTAAALSPEEVEILVTVPVERALAGLPRVTALRSLSVFGLSQITVVFEDGTDLYFARGLVFEKLAAARQDLPEGVGEPRLGPPATGLGEIYQYELRGEGVSLTDLRTLQEWDVARRLLAVPGVAEVSAHGGLEKRYEVVLDPVKLEAHGLTASQVFSALRADNRNVGLGYAERAGERFVVRALGLAQAGDLGRIPVAVHEGTPVRVEDVAQVRVGSAPREGAATRDARGEIVTATVMMRLGENSREVAQRVGEAVHEIAASLPPGVRLEPYYDRTALVDRTIATVARNLAEGALLVALVLFLTLGDGRAAALVSLTIPLSLLLGGILMVGRGLTGNLMSLGALDFGMIVDGSVVMVENVLRRLRPGGGLPEVRAACAEIARPVVFGVAIIGVVYLPVLSLEGTEGRMFRPMAWTVLFALVGSLVLAMTTVPVLASLWLRPRPDAGPPWLIRQARTIYAPLLERALRRPGLLAALSAGLLVASLALVPRLGAEFLPRLDEGALALEVVRLPSASLPQSLEMATRMEEILLEFPEVETVVNKTGRAEIAFDPMGVERSDTFLALKPRSSWRFDTPDELVEAMEERLREIPGLQIGFSQPIELRMDELLAGVRGDVALKIFGDDLRVLQATAARAAEALRALPGAADVKVEQVGGRPYLDVRPDRAALARLGLSMAEVQDALELAAGVREAGFVLEGERRFPLAVRLPEGVMGDPAILGRLPLRTPAGATVPLAQVAEIRLHAGLAQMSREDGRRRIVITANVRGGDLVGFVSRAKRAVAPLLPPGTYARWGGTYENYESARRRLEIVVPAALALILLLLWGGLGSLRQALLVFCNVPFAVTGGVVALFARGMPFSISAGVGFIALFGVAMLNGVVLVSAVNRLREEGGDLEGAVRTGSLSRLRPVLTTALVASLGFVPMALSHGAGAEVQKPLATVVIGGLLSSTLLTLLVLPSLYLWNEGRFGSPGSRGNLEA